MDVGYGVCRRDTLVVSTSEAHATNTSSARTELQVASEEISWLMIEQVDSHGVIVADS